MVKLTLDMVPVAQARPRLGKYGVYNPTAALLKKARLLAFSAWNGQEPLQGPVSVSVTFYMGIGSSIANGKALEGTLHSRKPDLDNLEKFLFDALNGICYRDDAQIAQTLGIRKIYSVAPRIEIDIWELEKV